MGTFNIHIDGRLLFNNRILLLGPDGNAVGGDFLNCHQLLSLPLQPGEYRIGNQTTVSDFSFTVTPHGGISILPEYEEFMQVVESKTLKLKGYTVKADARYLTGSGILWPTAHVAEPGDGYKDGFFKCDIINLLPGLAYYISTGSGLISSFYLKLTLGKEWQVLHHRTMQPDPVFDNFIQIQNNAYIPEINILGYPLLIDGRSAKFPVTLMDVWSDPAKGSNHTTFDHDGVVFANLLPLRQQADGFGGNDVYSFQTENGTYAEPNFYITNAGEVLFDSPYELYFKLDFFNGLKRLTVTYPLPDKL